MAKVSKTYRLSDLSIAQLSGIRDLLRSPDMSDTAVVEYALNDLYNRLADADFAAWRADRHGE